MKSNIRLLTLDANVFIAALKADEPQSEKCAQILTKIPKQFQLTEPSVIYQEVCGTLARKVDLEIANEAKTQMDLMINPKLLDNCDKSSSVQSVVTVNAQNLILTSHGTVLATLSSACINMHLDQPNGQNSFTIRTTPTSSDLIKLINLTYFNSETARVKQFAIWTITDNPTRYGYTQLGSSGSYSGPTDAEMQTDSNNNTLAYSHKNSNSNTYLISNTYTDSNNNTLTYSHKNSNSNPNNNTHANPNIH